MTRPCDQAWPAGLSFGILHECRRSIPDGWKGHTGKHINAAGDLRWSGPKLTEQEITRRDYLRRCEPTGHDFVPFEGTEDQELPPCGFVTAEATAVSVKHICGYTERAHFRMLVPNA